MYMIPFSTAPNHRFRCMVPVDGDNLFLEFYMHYNRVARYWVLDIYDDFENCLASAVPIITGLYPAANLLEQHSYLGIGAAVVVPVGIAEGEPDDENLGQSFVVVWGDTM